MAEQTIPTKFKLRHDIASNWTAKNPVLLEGEVGFETDTKNFKVGNGTSSWQELQYYIPDANNFATNEDIFAIINYGTNMSYGKNTQVDWYYQHQYLHFGEITTVGQKVLNLYSKSYNAGDYQSHTIYIQELVVVDISKGTGLSGSDVITFTPTKESYSGFYSNNMYHTLGTSNYDKQVVMSRYGISKALEGLNKTIIRRWS